MDKVKDESQTASSPAAADSTTTGNAVEEPSLAKTICIALLLLIPFAVGLKISLLSRDLHIRKHFAETFSAQGRVPDIIWGLTNALMPLGGCIGALTVPRISALLGTKQAVFLCVVIGLVGEGFLFLSYFNKHYFLLAFSRLFDGLSNGSTMNAGLLYFFDLLPPTYANIFMPLVQLSINAGIVVSGIFSLERIISSQWFITSLPLVVVQLLLLAIVFIMPESPSFLFSKNRNSEEIKAILQTLRGRTYTGIDAEVSNIKANVEKQSQMQSISIWKFLTDRTLSASIFIMSFIQIFQQISGINAIIFYANNFMEKANFQQADLGSLIMFLLCLFGSIVFTPILSKYSGKTLLIVGYAGMATSFLLSFFSWVLKAPPIVTVIFLAFFVFIFQIGPGPKPWTITMDTYTIHHRLAAQGFFTCLNWGSSMLVAVVYMWASEPLDFYVSLLFGAINVFACLFLAFLMVNPHRKSQEEVMQEYQTRLGWINKA